MRNLIAGFLIAGGLMAQQFGSKAGDIGVAPQFPVKPGTLSCKLTDGELLAYSIADIDEDILPLAGMLKVKLAGPAFQDETYMLLPTHRIQECTIRVTNKRVQ